MSEEDGPKSAIELAMERLRKEDAEAEVTTRKLTDEEKAAIAEVRSPYDSRTAEQEILHRLLTRSKWSETFFGMMVAMAATSASIKLVATVAVHRVMSL